MTRDQQRGCIDLCQRCHQVCVDTLSNHCLPEGGEPAGPEHVKLMLDCIAVCAACVESMIRKSAAHASLCRACSEICEMCADDCERVGGMDDCVDACRACSACCAEMAALTAA